MLFCMRCVCTVKKLVERASCIESFASCSDELIPPDDDSVCQTSVPLPSGLTSTSMANLLMLFSGCGQVACTSSWIVLHLEVLVRLLARTDPRFMKILRLDMGLGRIKNLRKRGTGFKRQERNRITLKGHSSKTIFYFTDRVIPC